MASAGFIFIVSFSTNAAVWYVDNTATGANNGTSWANAWTSLSSASGASVAAGDTVYISGGPNGSSQSYAIGSGWSPKSGSSSGRITYQIGQDAAHNGKAIFNLTSQSPFITTGTPSYINIVGDAGDGQRHFQVNNCSTVFSSNPTFTDFRLGYVNFGIMQGAYDALRVASVNNFEFDHCYMMLADPNADGVVNVNCSGSGYDQNLFHDNTLYAPTAGTSNLGSDCFQLNGSGYTFYNNTMISYVTNSWNAAEGQHQDGWQTGGGTYIKMYNNFIYGFRDIGLYGGCWGNAVPGGSHTFSHVRIYNNIIDNYQWQAVGSIEVEADDQTASTFSDIIVANNICRVNPGAQGWCLWFGSSSTTGGTWTGNYASNNICIAPAGQYIVTVNCTFPQGDNPQYTDAQAANLFAGFIAGSANSNYHLASGATSLIGQGANLTAVFTTDKDGNSRPATGPWDIGAYVYQSNLTNVLPTVSAISANATDISSSQSGLQIYGGTVVSLSATAANALTYQWRYTVNGGSPVVFQSGSGAVPAVNFSYGTNTIGNTYAWTLIVSNNQGSAQSQLTLNVIAPPVASSSLTFAAQSGSITSPFVLGTNGTTIYISQPVDTVGINGNGIATYSFMITNAGNYEIQALVNAPNTAANSLYFNVDTVPQDPGMIWDILTTSGFEERLVSWRGNGTDTANQFVPWIFPLTNGVHQILIYGREANTQLAGFSILQAPPTPPPPIIISQ